MIKSGFGIKNILTLLFDIPFCIVTLIGTCAFFGTMMDGSVNIVASIFMILLEGFLATISFFDIRAQIFPNHFKCMDAVGNYIDYKDLKELLKDEGFVPFEFPQDIVDILRQYRVKAKHYEIQFSENWVYVRGVYIPKKMIIGTYAREFVNNHLDEMRFELVNECTISFGCFHRCCGIPEAYFNKGIEIPNIKQRIGYRTKKFKETVKTKEDFINFLNDNEF